MRAARLGLRRFGRRGFIAVCALFLASLWSIGSATAAPLVLEIARATTGLDQRTGKPIVNVVLREASKRAFDQFTSGKVGSKMELRVNGQVLSTAVLREPLLSESFQISGDFSVDETNAMAGRLSTPGVRIEIEFVD